MTTIAEKIGIEAPEEAAFDLRQTIRDLLADQTSADPNLLTEVLIQRLTAEQKDAALLLALPRYVQDVARFQSQRLRRGEVSPDRVTTPQRIANWYAETLSSRLFNGAEWKFLADCGAEDLQGAAAERYKLATNAKAEADKLVALADFLDENEYSAVGDLSEVELRKVLGGQS